jgi:DNA topoisomerase-2
MTSISEKTITEAIDTDYKEYAMYTISNRAIPCYIDGFKPSSRKILYGMLKEGKNRKVKVADAGSISKYNYHHAEQAAMGAVVTLSADWNNNAPIFKQHGAFGTRLIPEAAAPRYIHISLSDNFDKYFQDFDVLEYDKDPDNGPEPKTYLPNIPWVLVNGIKGIAVGFACTFLPHNPKDIAEIGIKYLNGKNIDNEILKPTFPDFYGDIIVEDHNKFKTVGKIEKKSKNQWEITEVPVGYTREKYFDILTKLMNDGKIQDFDDNSSKGFNFVIKVDPKQDKEIAKDPIKYFKLEQTLTENYTALDENSHLVLFEKKTDIIKKFFDYRVAKIKEQIDYDLDKINKQMIFNEMKIIFIEQVLKNEIDLRKLNKKELISHLEKEFEIVNDSETVNKLIGIPVYSMTVDAVKELEAIVKKQEKEIIALQKLKPKTVMLDRLKKIAV